MTSDHVWGMTSRLGDLPNVEIVAGADPHDDLLVRFREQFGVNRLYTDHREMYQNENVDAILICADNAAKVGLIEEAARHTVHVYQDKPMSATLSQADGIIAAAESAGIKVVVAYHNYFGAAYGEAKKRVADGDIGEVYLARALIGHAGPKEFGCSPHFCDWLFDREKNGGGTFIDEACYVISAFLDYMGPIVEVSAFMTQIGYRDYLPADVEDNSVAIVRFETGALGVIDSRWGQIGPMPWSSSYHGTEGTILVRRGGISLYSRKGTQADAAEWVDIPCEGSRPETGSEAEYVARCLSEDVPVHGAVSPQGARATQEVIEAAYRSAQTGQVVKLPL